MEGNDQMLGDLYPGVNEHLRQGREGNPLEQAVAVGKGEITEAEIMHLVDRFGVLQEYNKLPDKLKPLVNTCLSGLWKIDKIGRGVEGKDESIVGSVGEMKSIIRNDSDEIKRNYHGNFSEWLAPSVSYLVKAASENDPKRSKSDKDGVMIPTDNYIRKLRTVGIDYRETARNISDTVRKDKVVNYLNSERENDLGMMKKFFSGEMNSAIDAIGPIPEDSK
jgi:hypothetical protein